MYYENNKSNNFILNHNKTTGKLPYEFKYSKDLNKLIKQPIGDDKNTNFWTKFPKKRGNVRDHL